MESDEGDYPYDSDLDEDYYIDSDQYDSDEHDLDHDFYEHVGPKVAHTVLNESDIILRQEDEVSHVSSTLSVSKAAASSLLCYYRWNVLNLHDHWFDDEAKVRSTVGLFSSNGPPAPAPAPAPAPEQELVCGICFDSLPRDQFYQTVCGHLYCVTCWKGYITVSVNEGPGCLTLRCPEPSCRCVMGRDVINELASDSEKLKYSRYFLQTYVMSKKMIKWCPGPGCEYAVEFERDNSIYDVTCTCSHSFCWNCTEDAHRPLDCDTVAKWVLKNNSEAENTMWILAQTKPCPNCKRSIEKNQGCMHMTCTPPCNFEFCWLCLGSWKLHRKGNETDFYSCNRYEKEKDMYAEEEKKRDMAQKYIERYTHYYERWAGNQQSREKAIKDLHMAQTVNLKELSNKVKIPETQLKFITAAWEQIIECRRVLKWTYAYAYYLPENGKTNKLFEYLQGLAESALERLHICTEKELSDDFLRDQGDDKPAKDFLGFEIKLVNLTKVTRSFFENLVRALENGLSEGDSEAVDYTADGLNESLNL